MNIFEIHVSVCVGAEGRESICKGKTNTSFSMDVSAWRILNLWTELSALGDRHAKMVLKKKKRSHKAICL